MDFQSVADLLHFAISKEVASQQFYLDLASQMSDPATQSIFQAIAKQEKKHEEMLKLEMLKKGYTLREEENKRDVISDYDWQERLELNADAKNMSFSEALMVAIQKERAAFQLYAQLIAMVQDTEFRKMLLELAEEEMRHVIKFEREYDSVTHS
jgi:rubrerythrin